MATTLSCSSMRSLVGIEIGKDERETKRSRQGERGCRGKNTRKMLWFEATNGAGLRCLRELQMSRAMQL